MIKRTLAQLKDMIQIENDVTAFEEVAINGVSIDSRKITPGNLFVPFKGEHSDGHRFVEDALKKGAACGAMAEGCAKPSFAFADSYCRGHINCTAGAG